MKPMWAIKNGKSILPFTLRVTRAQCIAQFCYERSMTITDFKAQTFNTCVRVTPPKEIVKRKAEAARR